MNNFFRRTLTGAWIVVFILGGFWLHPVTFFLTGLVILAGTQYEYCQMLRNSGVDLQMIPGMISGALVYIIATIVAAGILPLKYLLIAIIPVPVIMITELYRKKEKPFDSITHTIFSIVYSALPLSLFPFAAFSREGIPAIIGNGNFSPGIVVAFFILLWTNDTGAYLSGVTFGNHRLLERISPKKSWEGFFGGMVLTVAAAWLLSLWMATTSLFSWIIIALIISFTGTYGDLAESMLKRSLGVKDTGSILPGHGGFLDRFDSTLLSFPLVFLFIFLFG